MLGIVWVAVARVALSRGLRPGSVLGLLVALALVLQAGAGTIIYLDFEKSGSPVGR